MTYNYNTENKERMTITLENGITISGEMIDLRITPDTIPANKKWYHLRHADEDWGDIASIKNGCVVVNFFGTFICDQIECLEPLGTEINVTDYSYDND